MSILPPANAICAICQEDFTSKQSFCESLFSDRSIMWVSGKEHPHHCFFHYCCFMHWSYFTSPPEEDDYPFFAGGSTFVYCTKCPNDRCKITDINGKQFPIIDRPISSALITLAALGWVYLTITYL